MMDKLKIFKILKIEETKDKNKIKEAYRTQLLYTNPEDNPDAFKELREAFDEANRFSDEPSQDDQDSVTDDTPIGRWIKKVEECYNSFSKRIDVDEWKSLLSDRICLDLDTSLETRDKLLSFLMDNFRLPRNVFQLIDEVFFIIEEKEELKERFPINFLNFIEYQINNDHFINLYLFKGTDNAQYDEFITEYLNIKEKIDAIETKKESKPYTDNKDNSDKEDLEEDEVSQLKDIEKSFDDISRFDIYHPFLDVEKIKYALLCNKQIDPCIVNTLYEQYSDIIYIKFALITVKWHNKEYEEAYKELVLLLDQCPEHYPAKTLVADYYFINKEYIKAKEECENLLNINSTDNKIYDLLKKTNEFLIRMYEEQLEDGTINFDDLLELGWSYYENERGEDCRKLLCNITPDEGHYLDYHNLLGRIYVSLHEYETALPLLAIWEKEILKLVDDGSEKYKKKHRRFVLARYLQALCCHELSLHKEALDFLDFDIDSWDDISICLSCHNLKAQVLLDLNMAEQCIDVCRHVISIDSSYFPAYVIMQQAYEILRDAQMVIDTFYQAIEIYPDYVKPYTLAAKVFFYVRQYEDSKKIIQMARERNLQDLELDFIEIKVLRFSAETFDETNNMIPLCDKLIEKLIETKSCDTNASQLMSNDANASQLANSKTEASKPGNDDPCIHDVYYEKIYAYMDIELYEQALNTVNDQLKKYANIEEYYRIKAKILHQTNQAKEALPIFKEHIKEEETDSSYLYGMACCYDSLNQTANAIETYKKVLEVNPNHYNANSKLSNIYLDMVKTKWNRSNFNISLDYAKKQLEINSSGYYYIECALVYIEGYQFEEAIECLNKVIEIEPDNLYAYNNLGWIYQLTRKDNEAVEMYKKAIELNKDLKTTLPYQNLADMYIALHEYDKAYEVLLKCNELFTDINWNRTIGNCLASAGRYSEALSAYETAIQTLPSKEALITERIALLYETKSDLRNAKKNHKKHLLLNNSDIRSSIVMGNYYLYSEHNFKKAYKYYYMAYKSALNDKNSSDYLFCLSRMSEISYFKGDLKFAGYCYEEAISNIILNYNSVEEYIDCPSLRNSRIFKLFLLCFHAGYQEKAEHYLNIMSCNTRCTCCEFGICVDAYTAKAYFHLAKKEYEQALKCLYTVQKEDNSDLRIRFEIERLIKKHLN